jgi:hypothetical protein
VAWSSVLDLFVEGHTIFTLQRWPGVVRRERRIGLERPRLEVAFLVVIVCVRATIREPIGESIRPG